MKKLPIYLIITLLFSSPLFATENISIMDPYAFSTSSKDKVGAIYLKIKNQTKNKLSLVKVKSSIAKNIEIHKTFKHDNVFKMVQIPYLQIGSDQEIALKPGSYHLMLIGLKKQLKAADTFRIRLIFNNGDVKDVTVKIKNRKVTSFKSEGSDHHHAH